MATTNTTSTLDGYFKRRYGDNLERLTPDFAILAKRLGPLRKAEKIGDSYRFPAKLTRSHGITWAGGSNAGTAFALRNPIAMVTKEANVTGCEVVLRDQIAYGVVSRSGGKEESFGPAVDEIVLEMVESTAFYREMAFLYGQTSIGALESVAGSSTTRTWTISKASWSPGLWSQMENAELDVYDSTLATQRNTNATVVVTAINADNATRTVSVSGNATDLTACVATDVLVPRGAFGNWFAGIDKVVTNTGSLFGIDASVYNLWKGNSYSASSAAVTMGKVQAAINTAIVRGLMEPVIVLVSPFTWTDLLNDLMALRRFANDTRSEVDIGSESIKFFGANGLMEFVPHAMVKAGEAFIITPKRWVRIGSTDTTFRLPDAGEDRFVRQLTDNAGFEVRCYFDQAMICTHPARQVKITGIVNNSL